ncbi:hypothetical protein COO60DRAFT_492877 [Scenedesmus sp. NREL 46B-D3]|nr:hypothetical protein COO60DRAFT_492877 [Scenedesmus sp. NREL 46B-D3]
MLLDQQRPACGWRPTRTCQLGRVTSHKALLVELKPGQRWTYGLLTEQCPCHHICRGGTAQGASDGSTECGNGLLTQAPGSRHQQQCLVPRGHYLLSGTVVPCPTGSYQPSWLNPNSAAAAACLACGTGVLSEPRTADAADGACNTGLTAASRSDCFIRRGQGMVIDSRSTRSSGVLAFRAVTCRSNNYGTQLEKKYGLARSPCKDCPVGTVTSESGCNGAECPDPSTGGFYDAAACKYPTDAKCSNIHGDTSSNPAMRYFCDPKRTPKAKYDTAKAGVSIAGQTRAAAYGLCCSEVYAQGATCSSSDIQCPAGSGRLDAVGIGGLTPTEAETDCCRPTCASHGGMCSSGVYDADANSHIILDSETFQSVCCKDCTSITCASPTVSSTVGAGVTPTQDACCVYPSGAACGDVDGDGGAGTAAVSCGPGAPAPNTATTSIAGKSTSDAQQTCCQTSCADYRCTNGAPKNPLPAPSSGIVAPTEDLCCDVYPSTATCSDVNGDEAGAVPVSCGAGASDPDAASELIFELSTSAAQQACCQTAEPEAPAICPTPTELSVASACSAEPVDSSACCVYPPGATCSDTDGQDSTSAAFDCTTAGSLKQNPESTALAGVAVADAFGTCCEAATGE